VSNQQRVRSKLNLAHFSPYLGARHRR